MSTAAARRTRAFLRLSPATTATTGTTASATRQPLHQRQTPAQEATAAEGGDAAGTACPICFDSLVRPGGGGRLLRSSWAVERVWLECNHAFCQECLSQYASVAVQEGKTAAMAAGSGAPLECPVHGCKVAMSEATLKRLLSPADWERHLRFTADAAVAADPRLKPCPQRRCNGMARLGAASLALLQASASSSSSSSGGTYVEAVCDTCAHPFCADCAAGAHPGKTCEAVGDEGFFRWKRGRPVKPCPFCSYQVCAAWGCACVCTCTYGCQNSNGVPSTNHQVEKRGGCDHMYCVKCRNHWCWRCLKAQASCSC